MTESSSAGGGTASPVPSPDLSPSAADPGPAPGTGPGTSPAPAPRPGAEEDSAESVDQDPAKSVDQDPAAVPPSGLWERMKADPQYAPEHLALEAVRRLGPEARAWVERTRAYYPDLSPDGVAEVAIRKFVTRAQLSGAISGAAGLPGAVLDMGVLAWTQARMVLHVAAAYGHDPEHADRATDLLVLQRVHKIAQTARLALGVAAGRERAGAMLGRSETPLRKAMLRLGLKLAQMAGVRAAKRLFAKAVPGAAIILGTWANSSATKDLAARSQELYRQRPAIMPPPPATMPES
ncbi:EcsC family protein [Plantactinospora solaniradicis]|uniref:EcsC family protein n=1 Tax=Plantactinospora solaniradicis TaxID=1723736 RepID=A0ABW1KLW1_9ACTN